MLDGQKLFEYLDGDGVAHWPLNMGALTETEMFICKRRERIVFSISISLSAIRVVFLRFTKAEIIESKVLTFGGMGDLFDFGHGDIKESDKLSSIVKTIVALCNGANRRVVVLLSIPDGLSYWFAGNAEEVERFRQEIVELSAVRDESVVESRSSLTSARYSERRYLYIAAREDIITKFMNMLNCLYDSIELIVPQHWAHISSFRCADLVSREGICLFLGGEYNEGTYSLWHDGRLIARGIYGDQRQDDSEYRPKGEGWMEAFFEECRAKANNVIDEVYVSGALGRVSSLPIDKVCRIVTNASLFAEDGPKRNSVHSIYPDICTGSFDDCLGLISLYDENVIEMLCGRTFRGD